MFIAIYGINKLGKSEQTKMLKEHLIDYNRLVAFYKFPLYDLKPTGPLINDYLRNGNPHGFSPREFQLLNIQNRLEAKTRVMDAAWKEGALVIAEDWVGGGIAWGVGAGVDRDLLLALNSTLPVPQISILLDGEQFASGHETGHRHEEDEALTQKVRSAYRDLAHMFQWPVVNSNQPRENVHADIWTLVEPQLPPL